MATTFFSEGGFEPWDRSDWLHCPEASLRSLHQVPFPKAPKVPKASKEASKASANVKERSEIDVDVEAKPIPFSDGCLHLLRHLRSRDLYR